MVIFVFKLYKIDYNENPGCFLKNACGILFIILMILIPISPHILFCYLEKNCIYIYSYPKQEIEKNDRKIQENNRKIDEIKKSDDKIKKNLQSIETINSSIPQLNEEHRKFLKKKFKIENEIEQTKVLIKNHKGIKDLIQLKNELENELKK